MIEKKATLRGFVERLTKKPRRNQKELTIDRSRMLHRTTIHVSDFSVEQKNVMTDQRKCMDPTTLEIVTMLDENSDLWDAADIQEVAF